MRLVLYLNYLVFKFKKVNLKEYISNLYFSQYCTFLIKIAVLYFILNFILFIAIILAILIFILNNCFDFKFMHYNHLYNCLNLN